MALSNYGDIKLYLYNEVIKANLIINKKYGEDNNLINEENIIFNIYDSKNNIISTVTTNNDGNATILLPYGKYTLEKVNTKEGYKKNDKLDFIIDSEEDKKIYLKDLKIKVPNTHIDKSNIFQVILILLSLIICL